MVQLLALLRFGMNLESLDRNTASLWHHLCILEQLEKSIIIANGGVVGQSYNNSISSRLLLAVLFVLIHCRDKLATCS